MSSVTDLVVRLIAETAQFKQEMQSVHGVTKQIQGGLEEMGAEVRNTIAEYASFHFAKEAILAVAEATMEAEQSTARLEGVLHATGATVGYTAKQLDEMARAMSHSTMFDDGQIKNAAAALLTFRHVQGDTFKETLSLAGDVATVFGTDLQSATVQLGKALEDPVAGMTALHRIGVTFTGAQKEQIQRLMEQNRLFDAQAIVLGTVEKAVGGVSERMLSDPNSLTAATTAVKNQWKEFLEGLGNTPAFGKIAIGAVNEIAEALHVLSVPVTPELEGEAALQEQQDRVAKLHDEILKKSGQARLDYLGTVNPNDGTVMKVDVLLKREREYVEALAVERELNRELDEQRKARAKDDTKPHPTPLPVEDSQEAITARKRAADAALKEGMRQTKAQEELYQRLNAEDRDYYDKLYALQQRDAKHAQEIADEKAKQAEFMTSLHMEEWKKEIEQQQQQADEAQKVWRHAVQNISDDFAHVFSNALTGQIKSFKDFCSQILSAWANTIAQLAGAKLATSLFGGLLGAGTTTLPNIINPGVDIYTPNPLGAAPAVQNIYNIHATDAQSFVGLLQREGGPTIAALAARAVQTSAPMQRLMARGA